MQQFLRLVQFRGLLFLVYLANLFLSFHYFITAYVGSSFLNKFFSEIEVSFFYVVAAAINIVLFIWAPTLLKKFGNYKVTLILCLINLFSVIGISLKPDLLISILLFITYQAIAPIILYNFDIFLEYSVTDERTTGRIRALYLTISNVALVIAPLVLGSIGISNDNFSPAYFVAGLILLPLLTIVAVSLRHFRDPKYTEINWKRDWKVFLHDGDTSAVVIADFLLNFFYSWMVIYTPIYLSKVIGFSWSEIGLMLSIALLPFLLIELPAGIIADRYIGEKEMLGVGFVIMAIFSFLIPSIVGKNLALFTAYFFMTRVGAALVEMSAESHFFKKTKSNDTDMISIFRAARPLAYITGPFIGLVVLTIGNFQLLYVSLAAIMLTGLMATAHIKDSR